MRVKFLVASLVAAGLLAGCSLTPDYQRPAAPIAKDYPGVGENTGTRERLPAADIGWREFFTDRRLQALIETALDNNRDLRRAALNIEQSRALYGIQVSEQSPTLGGAVSRARERIPNDLSPTGRATTQTRYEVGLTVAAWELDFFGRLDSLSEAALAEYLATEEARRAAQISLVAEVGRVYLGERALAEQLALARQTFSSRQASYRLFQQRFDAGVSTELDLRQAEVLVQSARVAVAALTRQHAQAVNALNILVGKSVDDLPDAQPLANQDLIAELPLGLPSHLLEARPDIRAAEQRLIAANANIGAARAAFFPRIALTAGVGTASNELSNLFSAGTGTWSFVPQLTLPIFDAGRNERNLDLAQVRRSLAVVDYEVTIRQAFREVADALAARGALSEQLAAQIQLLEAQAERLRLAEQRYEGGVVGHLEVLDARRALFEAEQTLVQTRQLRLSNAIDLYRALGGGIQEQSVEISQR